MPDPGAASPCLSTPDSRVSLIEAHVCKESEGCREERMSIAATEAVVPSTADDQRAQLSKCSHRMPYSIGASYLRPNAVRALRFQLSIILDSVTFKMHAYRLFAPCFSLGTSVHSGRRVRLTWCLLVMFSGYFGGSVERQRCFPKALRAKKLVDCSFQA